MADLAQQVSDYVTKREDFLKLEETVFQSIRASFSWEVSILNKKLPEGYSIEDYRVSPPQKDFNEKPAIMITTVRKNGGYVSPEEFNHLNELLADEFLRIEKDHGFQVDGFFYDFHIP